MISHSYLIYGLQKLVDEVSDFLWIYHVYCMYYEVFDCLSIEKLMGLVLIVMFFLSMILLGLWERRRSKKRFLEATQKLKELDGDFPNEVDEK